MLDEHTNQRNEFRVFGVEKFRGGFMIGLFSMMVGAIVYLFLNCGHEKRELQGEIKELRHELIACKDSSMAKIERLKDQHFKTMVELNERQTRIEHETRKLGKKIKNF